MSFIPVLQYCIGIAAFGFIYWILDGVMDEFLSVGVHKTGLTFELLFYFWAGALLVYLIFGGWWVIRRYVEKPSKL
jgi:hypothetical protein